MTTTEKQTDWLAVICPPADPLTYPGSCRPAQIAANYLDDPAHRGRAGVAAVCEAGGLACQGAFYTLGVLPTLPDGWWPAGPDDYDRVLQQAARQGGQVDRCQRLDRPTQRILSEVDQEKIDALAQAYRALDTLRNARQHLQPAEYLCLEHYLHRLKGLCAISRWLIGSYLMLRGVRAGTIHAYAGAPLAKLRELRHACREYRCEALPFVRTEDKESALPLIEYLAACETEVRALTASGVLKSS